MTHPLVAVLNCTPIDRLAAVVASQKRCATVDSVIPTGDLQTAWLRLQRKQRLMKALLGVERPRQHANLVARWKAGVRNHKHRPTRLVAEYVRNGAAIQILQVELAARKGEGREGRRRLGAIESEWRARHPGAIWDGRVLVAPNGAVFSRAAACANREAA